MGASLGLLTASPAAQDVGERPTIGLVLSGGGARGAAHVGVLQVLEELRVPVDFVVGTSMGSIVGGLYAIGYAPDEMEEVFATADWPTILSDAPARDELWFRRRQDDRRFQIDVVFGWQDGGPVLPSGLLQGLGVEAFLDRLTISVGAYVDFDQLRIPFRCVATDIADGTAAVLARGNLPRAIRASMSLPGIFSPVTYEGRTLIDGGVVNNIPIDVARDLGADVIIAIDISTPLGEASSVNSLLGVSNRMIGILMNENRRLAMASLMPSDVGITPDLGDVSVMAFDRSVEAIHAGRHALEGHRDELSRFSVDEATWESWLTRQRKLPFRPPIARRVTIATTTRLSPAVIRAVGGLEPGHELTPARLGRTRQRLAGLGIFEHVEIDIVPVPGDPGRADVEVRPIEKSWGPHYLRFRIGVESDLRGGGEFDIGFQHTITPINGYAGEWRTEVEVGTRTRVLTELYQPLDPGLRWFLAPSLGYAQNDLPVILDGEKVAEVDIDGYEAALAFGRNLGLWGEARVRYGFLGGTIRPETAPPGLFPNRTEVDRVQLETSLRVDTLDSIRFPRTGIAADLEWEYSDESFGDAVRSVVFGKLGAPLTVRKLTFFPTVEAGSTIKGGSPAGSEFFLGGFQHLSGFGPQELSGNHYALGVLQTYGLFSDLVTSFSAAKYLGASLELGGVWQESSDVSGRDLLLAGSVFAALDSLLGPVYVAYGLAEGGERAAYVFVEPVF